jgi:hypothetical protein
MNLHRGGGCIFCKIMNKREREREMQIYAYHMICEKMFIFYEFVFIFKNTFISYIKKRQTGEI